VFDVKSVKNYKRGFRITGINEEMTQTITTVKIIQNSEKQRFFEILKISNHPDIMIGTV